MQRQVIIENISLEEFKKLLAENTPVIVSETPEEDRLYNLEEAAKMLSMAVGTLRNKKDAGLIGYVNDGNIKFKKQHITDYIKKYEHNNNK